MKLEYLKPGHCPICNCLIPHPAVVNIELSNDMVMPQPVCDKHFPLLLKSKTQSELLDLIKIIWIREIGENTQLSPERKTQEIQRINTVISIGGEA